MIVTLIVVVILIIKNNNCNNDSLKVIININFEVLNLTPVKTTSVKFQLGFDIVLLWGVISPAF